jgi:hypothetical protein
MPTHNWSHAHRKFSAEAETARAKPSDLVALQVTCAHCGEGVTLELADWKPDEPPGEHTHGCPSCGRQNAIETPGRVLWAKKGTESTGS